MHCGDRRGGGAVTPPNFLVCRNWEDRNPLVPFEIAKTTCNRCGCELAIEARNLGLNYEPICIGCFSPHPGTTLGYAVGGKMYDDPFTALMEFLKASRRRANRQ